MAKSLAGRDPQTAFTDKPLAVRCAALAVTLAFVSFSATRPHYGGVLRVEMREAIESAEPPQTGSLAALTAGFTISQWEGGRRAIYSADPAAAGGRPFLDSVEVQMGRPLHDQSIALNLGKADLVEFDASDAQRAGSPHKVWSSSPVRVLLLLFGPRVEDTHVREALALAVDRTSIHNVMLQRQGEISGALLPQWISGEAFLFPATTDVPKARSMTAALPPAARTFTLGVADPANRRIADRIALNARDAGLTISPPPPGAPGDVRLLEVRIRSADPATALAQLCSALGLAAPPRMDSPEALYAAERALLENYRVIPLFHLPVVYGVNPRVKGAPGITPLGEWRFENLWVEAARP
ncbi:MAG TPA: ABC transporter substrate-binding protein [Bryobacteraceae bacterium]|nr:ABC transporter substrate-binding protein [Bryobacteraceae bacterium]